MTDSLASKWQSQLLVSNIDLTAKTRSKRGLRQSQQAIEGDFMIPSSFFTCFSSFVPLSTCFAIAFTADLKVHYFFATTSTARTGEASRTLDSGIEDLIAHIDDLDSTDPTTTSVVYLTTVGTWAHRSLKDKDLAKQSDAV